MAIPLDVIIRTRGVSSRFQGLVRAVQSARNQRGLEVRCLVILNGADYQRNVLAWLQSQPDIVLRRLPEQSMSQARRCGRGIVTAPYFCYLDDDDEFIENALLRPIMSLRHNRNYDAIVTTGFWGAGAPGRKITEIRRHCRNPLVGLLDENWLAPGASFFRSSAIDEDLVGIEYDNHEWGYMALEMCSRSTALQFLDIPTVVINDSPASASKSLRYHADELVFLAAMRRNAGFRGGDRRKLIDKYRDTQHRLAWRYWKAGYRCKGVVLHLASLCPPYTLKYLLFSRKLIWRGDNRINSSGQ